MSWETKNNNDVSLAYIMERVEDDSTGKADYLTPVGNLFMDCGGRIAFKDNSNVEGPAIRDISFSLTDWAETQIYGKLGMPVTYFKRVREAEPQLAAQHFNFWARDKADMAMLRARVRGDNGIIRGVVTDKYSVLDNDTSMEMLSNILKGQEERFKIQNFYLDDKRMHIRTTFTDLTKQAGVTKDGKPDYLQLGMDLVNSEVGASSLNIISLVYRLVCSNGLRAWATDDTFSQRHIHLKSYEIQMRMICAVANALKTGEGFMEDYMKTIETKIENPFNVIDKIISAGGFSQEFADRAKNEYDGDNTAYGMINSLTAAARALPNERRLEAERFAGGLVGWNKSEWLKIDTSEVAAA